MKAKEMFKRNLETIKHVSHHGLCDDIAKMYQDAIDALELQEEKFIQNQNLKYDGRYGNCPNCGLPLFSATTINHCGHCGQKIAWVK